jgi:hypothetical protein
MIFFMQVKFMNFSNSFYWPSIDEALLSGTPCLIVKSVRNNRFTSNT